MHGRSCRLRPPPPGFLALAALATLIGCRAEPHGRAGLAGDSWAGLGARGSISHVVLFSLTDPADAPAMIVDTRATLGTIPGVEGLFCGRPLETGRAGALGDFDVCVCVAFKDVASYTAYLSHPAHQALVARWNDRFVSARVIDSEEDAWK